MNPRAPGRPGPVPRRPAQSPRAAPQPPISAEARAIYGRYFDGLDTDDLLQSSMADLYSAMAPERQFIDTHLLYIATQQLGRLELLQRAQLQAAQQTVGLLQSIAKASASSAASTGDLVDGLELVVNSLSGDGTSPDGFGPEGLDPTGLPPAGSVDLAELPPGLHPPPDTQPWPETTPHEEAPVDPSAAHEEAPVIPSDETSGVQLVDVSTGLPTPL